MRWVRFSSGARPRYGQLEGDRVSVVAGTPFTTYWLTGETVLLSQVRLLPPVAPRTFYAAGLNYSAHAAALADAQGIEPKYPKAADIGMRGVSSIIAHADDVIVPHDATEKVQYEGELVAVIGRTARRVSEEEAKNHVLGFTIGNDISERSWQASDATLWRAKSTDTFNPMGPWIETDFDLTAAVTTVTVNGETKISFRTSGMIFGVEHYIARISRYVTLYPGDVIWMGTEGQSANLQDGDVVSVSISGIGTLTNRIVRERRILS